MIKAVLFDWSGTLYSDYEEVLFALKRFPFSPQFSRKFFFHPFIKPMRYFFSSLDIRFPTFFEKNYSLEQSESKLVESTAEIMKFLKERGILIGIFSTQSEKLIRRVIENSRINRYIDYIEGGVFNKVPRIKSFIKKHGLAKDEVLYLSDLYEDLKEVKELGVRVCAVLWGYDKKERLKLSNPDSIIARLEELKSLV